MTDETPTRSDLAPAGLASAAAGFVDALIAGSLGGHRAGIALVGIVAALQLGWGMLATTRAERWIGAAGTAVNLVATVLWLGALTSGLSFVDGMHERRSDLVTVTALVLSAVAGFAGLARVLDQRDEDRPVRYRTSWMLALAMTTVGVGVLAAVVDSTPIVVPAPAVAPTTTVQTGLIGLPTDDQDPDSALTKLVEASGYGDETTTTVGPSTSAP